MNLHSSLLVILTVILMAGIAGAVPVTNPATLIGSNNVTLSGAGFASDGWFVWGQVPESEYWITPVRATTGGVLTYRISQSPLFGGSVYYFRACDATGCGNQESFTTVQVTPIPTLGIGGFYQNLTESGYDIPMIGMHLIDPYLWNGTPITIVFMLIFSPVFIGIWLRSRTVVVALILGFITGSFLLYVQSPAIGIGVVLPAEIVGIAQALCYISFAGAVLYIVHR